MKFKQENQKYFSIENINKEQKSFLEKISSNNILINDNLRKELTSFVGSFLNLQQLK